jgi:hypothetical protein
MHDPLTPNEQERVWSHLIRFEAAQSAAIEAPGLASAGTRVRTSSVSAAGGTRMGRSLSAAVVPEFAALESSSRSGGSTDASAMMAAAKKTLASYADKPIIHIFQAQVSQVLLTLLECFCAGLEARLPGITEWCTANAFFVLTVPLAGACDAEKLQSAVNLLAQRQYVQAELALQDWLGSFREPWYKAWRGNVSFAIAKANLDSSIAQQCQGIIMQLMQMEQTLVNELASKHPTSFVDLGAIAACERLADPSAGKKGSQLLVAMAMQGLKAAGNAAEAGQVEAALAHKMGEQIAAMKQALGQQNQMVDGLVCAYEVALREAGRTNEMRQQMESTLPSGALVSRSAAMGSVSGSGKGSAKAPASPNSVTVCVCVLASLEVLFPNT